MLSEEDLPRKIRTRDAERCRVRLTFTSLFGGNSIEEDGVFLIGTSQPPSEEATLPVDRPMPIPLSIQVPKGTPHPLTREPLKRGHLRHRSAVPVSPCIG